MPPMTVQTTFVNGVYELGNLIRGQVTARITPFSSWRRSTVPGQVSLLFRIVVPLLPTTSWFVITNARPYPALTREHRQDRIVGR